MLTNGTFLRRAYERALLLACLLVAGCNCRDAATSTGPGPAGEETSSESEEPAELVALEGELGESTIFRIRPPRTRRALPWLLLRDSGAETGGGGSVSGFDLDAIVRSRTRCEDARCVAELGGAATAFPSRDVVFRSGMVVSDSPESLWHLQGTRPGTADLWFTLARLDAFDARYADDRGFVSLGRGGLVGVRHPDGFPHDEYIYVGEVGDNDRLDGTIRFGAAPPSDADRPEAVRDDRARAAECEPRRLVFYREVLRRAATDGATCLDAINSGRVRALRALDPDVVPVRCYSSSADQQCSFVTGGTLHLNERSWQRAFEERERGRPARVCEAAAETVMLQSLLELADPEPPWSAESRTRSDAIDGCARACFETARSGPAYTPVDIIEDCGLCEGGPPDAESACGRHVCARRGCREGCVYCEGELRCRDGGWRCEDCEGNGRETLLGPNDTCGGGRRMSWHDVLALGAGQAAPSGARAYSLDDGGTITIRTGQSGDVTLEARPRDRAPVVLRSERSSSATEYRRTVTVEEGAARYRRSETAAFPASGPSRSEVRWSYWMEGVTGRFESIKRSGVAEARIEAIGFDGAPMQSTVPESLTFSDISRVPPAASRWCEGQQLRELEAALEDALRRMRTCLQVDWRLALATAEALENRTVRFACAGPSNGRACMDTDLVGGEQLLIRVFDDAYGEACRRDRPLSESVFHELLHHVLGPDHSETANDGRILQCEHLCYDREWEEISECRLERVPHPGVCYQCQCQDGRDASTIRYLPDLQGCHAQCRGGFGCLQPDNCAPSPCRWPHVR